MTKNGFLKSLFMTAAAGLVATSMLSPQASYAQSAQSFETSTAQTMPVDVDLQTVGTQMLFALDTSGSMSGEEYAMQLRAVAHAVNSEYVRNTMRFKSGDRTFSIGVIDFGTNAGVRVNWLYIDGNEINDLPYRIGVNSDSYSARGLQSESPDALDAFAQSILDLQSRREVGSTNIHEAFILARTMFENNDRIAIERRVLNLFGDGNPSQHSLVQRNRDLLAAMGVTVNGFAIVNETVTLEETFRDVVRTQTFTEGPCHIVEIDGQVEEACLSSAPGQVWAIARSMESSGNTQGGLFAFYQEVVSAVKRTISFEPS
jgi:hypothetical protein